jgi:multiple sugar transport system ATP-binding protein
MSSVSVIGVEKKYGSVSIMQDVSLEVPDGEFVVLVGPSGCGKSTLLRMIAGLEPVTGGQIRIGDRVVNDVPARDRDIAMVFQNYALYPHMNVLENLSFALKLRGAPKSEIEARVKKAADILGLASLLKRYPRELSGGQRQRVAMGRAIVRDPQVFLFDEPLSNLDAKLRVQMRTEIKELHQRLKTTTVYVTHDQIEALTMSDRMVVMRNGVIEQVGAPLDIYDRPVNTFVAGFIGSPAMNLIDVTASDGWFVGEGGIKLSPIPHDYAGKSASALYGIRPEHMSLGTTGIPTEVAVVEPTGSETLVVLRAGGREVNCLSRGRTDLRPGDIAHLNIDTSKVHLFAGENEGGGRLN